MQLPALIDKLQSSGRYTFTADEIAREWDRPDSSVRQALRRLAKQKRISRLRRGLFVIIPLEYRSAGSPPGSWFIDDLMQYLDQEYYVGLLSAAALHGAAHQQPMVFQVMTDRPTRSVKSGRVVVRFTMSSTIRDIAMETIPTETGTMMISSLETTVLDLVRFNSKAGGISNLATILQELSERIDIGKLEGLSTVYPTAAVQRLGYLLEHMGFTRVADGLLGALEDRRYRSTQLVSGVSEQQHEYDARWRVIVNEPVEAEL